MRFRLHCAVGLAILSITVLVFAALPPTSTPGTGEGFCLALPGYQYAFPRDHAAHPDFQTEWWYFTGHLNGEKPQDAFGYELTFFRTALQVKSKTKDSAWSLRDLYFAHFAISDFRGRSFWHAEKISRGALGLAGADSKKLQVWLEDWSLQENKEGGWTLNAKADGRMLQLQLTPKKPEVIHGLEGVSQKADGAGKATHYISFTRMKTSGRLGLPGREVEVTGESWYDHEFGSNQLSDQQAGWDWFSLQLASGEELMIYLLRKKDGCFDLNSSGTWVDQQGRAIHLKINELSVISTATWKSPKTRATYPARWEIRVPKLGVNVLIEPLLAEQELVTRETAGLAYWEGACRVTGSHRGRAYVELTGYEH